MKLTILNTTNRLKLVLALRQEDPNLTMIDAYKAVNNLPYTLNDLSKWATEELKKKLLAIANVEISVEASDMDYTDCYNLNINPPIEYLEACAWYDRLGEIEKKHVDSIFTWRQRPAYC